MLWKYKDGTSVLIDAGVVKEIDGPGAAKEPVAVSQSAEPSVTPVATVTSPTTRPPALASKPAVNPVPAQPVATPRAAKTSVPLAKSGVTTASQAVPVRPTSKLARYAGFIFVIVAALLMVVCKIMILVVAFKEGVGWGLGCVFVPIVTLIFIITHWADTKKFLAYQLLAGMPLLFLGLFLVS